MKGKRCKYIIGVIICIVILCIMCIPNRDNSKFWEVTIYQVINTQITLFFCFFLTQILIDRRRKVDFYERKLIVLQERLNDKAFFSRNRILVEQELIRIANLITHLKQHAPSKTEENFRYIEEQFTTVRELYDNHINKPDGIDSVKEDLELHMSHISSKIDSIILDLYET